MVLGVLMAFYGSSGGSIGNIFSNLEQTGFFSFILPFLLIFAIVFGILSTVNIFKGNKTVNGIIALAVGLMALQFDLVPRFFATLFPKLGAGIAVILVALILLGMFTSGSKDSNWMLYVFYGIGAIILLITIAITANEMGWSYSYWLQEYGLAVLIGVIAIVIIAALISSGNTPTKQESPLARALRGEK